MMKHGRILGAVLMFLLPLVLWVGLASGQSFRTGDTTTVPADETVNGTLFASGRTIDVAGTVDGDVICAGLNVTVSGTVNGDVICAGQTMTITGNVEGDVRLAGQSVNLGGEVNGNASILTSALSFDGSARVDGDLSAAGGDLVLNGEVGRDAALAAATTTLNGTIGRNVNASVENLRLRGQADIGGGLYYTSAEEADVAEGAQIAGETKRKEPAQTKGTFEAPYITGVGFVFYLIASLLILSLALVLFFPRAVHAASDRGVDSPVKALLTGFVAAIAVPVLIIVLMITVLGIPVAILLTIMWMLILILAGPIFGYYVGRMLLRTQTNPFLIMGLGSLIVLVLLFVPVLGFIVWLLAMWLGVGMLLLEFARRMPRPNYELASYTRTTRSRK